MNARKFRKMNRRELLKLTPIVALGAFAFPKLREPLLKEGLAFSDWASGKFFRPGHLAPTFAESDVTPFEKFPINGYDVDDPGVIFENWSLTVTGAVQKPGDYKLSQIQVLPRKRQNTRHICVEGWDVIGRFGGTPLSEFLRLVGRRSDRPLCYSRMRGRLLRVPRHGDRDAPANFALLRNVRPAVDPRARCPRSTHRTHQDRLQTGKVPDRLASQPCSREGRLLGRSGILVVLWTLKTRSMSSRKRSYERKVSATAGVLPRRAGLHV